MFTPQKYKGLLQSSRVYTKVRGDATSITYEGTLPKPTFADKVLQFLSPLCFWRVNAPRATRIIMQHTGRPRECIRLYSVYQERWGMYRCWPDEDDSWYAEVEKDEMILAGTWIVGVSKKTGKIVLDGRANDEG